MSTDCPDTDAYRRLPRDWVGLSMWFIGPMVGGLYALSLGRHAGYDFLNLRWFLGWLLLRDVEGMPGAIQSLAYQPYLNEGIVGLLSHSGAWWLPVVVLGAVHGMIIPLSYDVCRAVAPAVCRPIVVGAALSTLASPLTSVQVGRESGHLSAAVALLALLRHVTRKRDESNNQLVAILVVIAVFLKYSAILTVAVVLVTVVLTLPLRRAARTSIAFLGALWAAVAVSSMILWPASSSRLFAFGALLWQPFEFVVTGVAIAALGLFLWGFGQSRSQFFRRLSSHWYRYRGLALGMSLVALSASVRALRTPGDVRFIPDSVSVVLRRLLSSGDLTDGVTLNAYSVRDLEYAYFDLGKGLAILVAFSALMLLLHRARGDSSAFGPVHLAVIPGVAVWVNMAAYGYVRYTTEALVLLPIGAFALLSTVNVGRLLRPIAALSVSLVLLLPAVGLGGWRGYGHLVGRPGDGPLISRQEEQLLSGLIPKDATVFFFGNLTTWIAPTIDRVDLTWFVKPLRPSEVEADSAVLFYDPANVADLDKFSTREWAMTDCQALRFENVAVGWCRLDAHQVDE